MDAGAGGGREHPSSLPDRAQKISERLDRLIVQETARAGGKAPAYRELAERVNRIAGRGVISRDTIRNLHQATTQKGQPPNPTVETLDWLGLAFGIRCGATYFLDDAKAAVVDEQLLALDALANIRAAAGNAGVIGLAQRASGLSDNSLHMLAALADRLSALEAEAAGDGGGAPDRISQSGC
ncbi:MULTISPECIES: hypothetical protein [Streptomyces]|uniref:Transcriptional regulator n=1 Tax=Streptomyces spororaveus TaxID=284039 RepID=A0ABQ3TIN3_9ACTN|nr:hypothetical protein [Streptomyces spororaveus]MCM9079411.1 hypothetical protein [Streptomyces spororaveus]GHI80264.1 hypothetical protein Sspor_58250 [Streptomyces spororaveus]